VYFIGIDTGGTFTDFIAVDDSGLCRRWKTLSTPSDPSQAIIKGLHQLIPDYQNCSGQIVHGTTVGTNAFLERKGARTIFITTRGFEDVLWIGRQARPELYSFVGKRPPDLISRKDVLGLDERMDWQGRVLKALDKDSVASALSFCREQQAQSVAVGLLHSYINPSHENEIKKALLPLGIPISLSSEVLPEFREYERFSTTVINAYLGPVVGNYLKELEAKLNNWRIFIQQSHGGCQPASYAASQAVHTLLSGPAGGVQAALSLGKELGMENIITLDMGGTSTDVSLCAGKLTYTREYKIDRFPVAIPIIDIHTVGAGGGSIAWIDAGGILRVGPRSAGADPGPVCYGKGEDITVTDANLFLGRLLTEAFLGGRMELFPERISPRLQKLASCLGLDQMRTALGIIKLVNVNMVQALRAVSLEKGYDPREFVLVCFGGAAGLHGIELAQELEMRRVLFPAMAGVFSAMGMATADLLFTASQAAIIRKEAEFARLHEIESHLVQRLMDDIEKHGLETDGARTHAYVDVRYKGQSFEITVPLHSDWRDSFEQEHERLYGYSMANVPVETTAVRIEAKVPRMVGSCADFGPGIKEIAKLPRYKEIIFADGKKKTPVFRREEVIASGNLKGPLLIVDDFSTILVPEGWALRPLGRHLMVEKLN